MWHPLNDVRKKAIIWYYRMHDPWIPSVKLYQYFNEVHPWKLKKRMAIKIWKRYLNRKYDLELYNYLGGAYWKLRWYSPLSNPPFDRQPDWRRPFIPMEELEQGLDLHIQRGGTDGQGQANYFDF